MSNSGSDELALAAEFSPATREQWLRLVEGILKGQPFDRLVARTYDNLRIEPLYAGDPRAHVVAGRAPGRPWELLQRVDHPDPAAANAQALNDLENGADGLSVVFAGSPGAYGYGLDATALDRALEGIVLDAGISLELHPGPRAESVCAGLTDLVRRRGIDPRSLSIRFGFDPIGAAAVQGTGASSWREARARLAAAVADLAALGFNGPFAAADGRIVHDAGGSEAQELAVVLAVAIACLRAFEEAGIALAEARSMIFFRLVADADQILTLAKFRALRKLWARVESACGLEPAPAFVSAETAWRMMTRRDPHVNILRTTMAAFAAGLGGANAVTVLPFTAALGLPDGFARRLARNTQLVLLHESNLAKVTDPAAGSGGIEDLTTKLCTSAWSLLQEIETAGGAWSALEQGLIQSRVAEVRAARERAVAHRKEVLTGTSDFPDLNEAPVRVLDVDPVNAPATTPASVTFPPLPSRRLAEPFERLRDASDRALAATGKRPRVFLANLGPLAAFTARATFARNFFEAGGIEAVTNDGFVRPDAAPTAVRTDLAALAAAFAACGTAAACLCSSDEIYEHEAAAAARALAQAGARCVYLAGRPREREQVLRASGVHAFIYRGCDALQVLSEAQRLLGLA